MGPTRRLLSGATFLASLFVSAILLISTVSAAPPQKPTTKTLIVKMAKGLTQAQQRAAVNGHGGSPKGSIPKLDIQILEVPEPAVDAVKKSFEGDAAILRVEENHQRRFQSIPSDAFYSNQWALPKIGWEDVYGSSSIVPRALTNVAILDTGVDASHPDLVGNIGASTSFIADADPLADANGHGTWLAGIVAARTGNLQGVAGVGFDHVQIMPVKVLGDDGLGYDSEIIQGVIWAADNGASVILMAFSNPGFSQSLQDAIDYAWSKNVVLVAAAGNDGNNAGSFPAGDKGVIGVSATDRDDNLANGSNYGASVFLAAPGVDILGTYKDHSYVMWSGTSASAAIVAGSAALMRSVDPTLDNGVVVSRIARTADPAGTQDQTGNGRVNIARALSDTSTDSIQPAGSAPLGDGGPFVGPYRTAATSGDGTMTVSPSTGVAQGSTGNSFTFTFTNNGGSSFATGSQVTLLVPAGWTAPTTAAGAGNVTVTSEHSSCATSIGTITGGGPWTIPITQACNSSKGFTLAYTSVTAASSVATHTFTTKTKNGSGGTLTNITTQPTVTLDKASQSINVTQAAPGSAAYNSSFTVKATATSGLNVSIAGSVACSGSGSDSGSGVVITMTAPTGTCTVTYSQSGDSNYNAATNVTNSTTASKANQTITVTQAAPASAAYNASFTVKATTTATPSLNPSIAGSGACTGSGTDSGSGVSITMSAATGTCTVTYSQSGNANYNAATNVINSTTASKADQTGFSLTVPASITYAATGTATTSGGQGTGSVSFSHGASTGCTVNSSSGVISVTNASNTCSITATKAADTNYNASSDGPKTVTLNKANQTGFSLAVPSSVTYGATGTATTSGGQSTGSVTFGHNASTGCTIVGSTGVISVSDASGTCSISATKASDNNYNQATAGPTSVTLNKANQTGFSLTTPAPITYGTTGTASAAGGQTATAPTFSHNASTGCTIDSSSGVVSVTDASGSCSITANKAGNNNYNPAADGPKSVTLVKANQTGFALTVPASVTYGTTGTASAAGGQTAGAVTFTDTGSTGCAIDGSTGVISVSDASATCSINATKAGNNNYNPAADGPKSVTLVKANQTGFALTVPPSVTYGTTGTASATGGQSGGAVTFTDSGSTGCAINGASGVISVSDASGTCSIGATKAGNNNYNPASDAPKSVTLVKANQTGFALSTPASITYGTTGTATATGGQSAGAVTFSDAGSTGCAINSSSGVISVSDASGACSITANLAGNNNYNPASDGPKSVTLVKANQTGFALTVPSSVTFGTTANASASGGQSTGAVTYTQTGSTGCAIDGATGEISVSNASGTCSVSANRAADNNYNAISDGPKPVTLAKANQSALTLTVPATVAFGSTGTATVLGGSGGGAVTFSSTGSTGCSVDASTGVISVSDASGLCSISAAKASDNNYNAAADGPKSVSLTKANQAALTLTVPASIAFGSTGTATAAGGSGSGALTFSSAGSTGCSVDASTGVISVSDATGTCAISASKAGDSNYNGPVSDGPKTVTLAKANQAAFTLTVPGSVTFGSTGTASVSGGSGSGAVSFSAAGSTGCAIDASTGVISVTNASGTCAISSAKAADNNYNVAGDGPKPVTLTKASQAAFTLTVSASITYGATGTASAAGGSGSGAVAFSSGASTGCSVDASTGVISVSNASGTCDISATKAADSDYNAAGDGPKPVTLNKASQAPFTLTVPAGITYGATGTASAAGGSGSGAVTFSSGASTGCSVDASTGIISVSNAGGTCDISATKASDNDYNSASDGPKPVTLNKASQAAFTLTVPSSVTYSSTETASAAGGSGGGAISFSSTGSTGCSVDAATGVVSVSDASGTCAISASKGSDSNYNATSDGPKSVALNKASQAALTLTVPSSVTFGSTGSASTTGGSGGGAVSFSSTGSTGCSVDASTGVISVSDASGNCAISASKAGDNNYNGPVSDGPKPVTLTKASQAAFTLTAPASITFGSTGSASAAGGSGGGAVTFSSGASTGCAIDASTGLIIVGNASGTCDISTTKAADSNYNAASDGPKSVALNKASQAAFTLTVPAGITFGSTGTASTAGGSGGGAISFSSVGSTGCSVDASTGVISVSNASGTCDITALKAPDSNFNGTGDGPKSVTLTKTSQAAFTLTVPSSITFGSTGSASAAGGSGGGAISFSSTGSTGCSVDASTGVISVSDASGTCAITATKAADSNYDATSDGPKSVTLNKSTQAAFTLTVPSSITYGSTGAASAAGGSGGGAVSFSSTGSTGCSVDASTGVVSVSDASGTCAITATKATDSNYSATSDGPKSVTLNKASQAAFTLTVPSSVTFGSTGTASAAGGSGGGAVSFSSTGSTGCSVDASTGVISVSDASGNCAISASKAGDNNYNGPVSDGPKPVTLTKASQAAFTLTAPASISFGSTGSASAAGGSGGGAVTFSSGASTGCAIDSSTGVISVGNASGTCAISATKAADSNYNAASDGPKSVALSKASQAAFTLTVPASITFGSTGSASAAGGSGGGAISFSSVGSTGCSVDASTGVISVSNASGTCDITALKAADSNFNGTGDGPKAVTLTKASQAAFTLTVPSSITFGSTGSASAAGGSGGGAISFSSGASTGCSIDASTGVISVGNASGTCDISATKATDSNYDATSDGPKSVTLNKSSQAAFTLTVPSSITFGSTGAASAAGGSGGGAVSFSSTGSTGCSVDASTGVVSVSDASGTCAITATKATDSNYNSTSDGPKSVALNKASQAALTLTVPASITYGSTGSASTAGGSGGGAVSFSSTGSTGCSVDAATGVISVSDASGNCAISASKAGDNNYNGPVSDGPKPVTLTKASQAAFTLTVPSSVTFGSTGTASAAGGSGGGAVSFSSTGSTGCSVDASTGLISVSDGSGTCAISAAKAGDSNYNGTGDGPKAVALTKASQAAFTLTVPSSITYGSTGSASAAGGSGGGAVSFSSTGSTGCSVDASTGVISVSDASGSCAISATKAADSNYNATGDGPKPVTLTKASQAAFTLTVLPSITFGSTGTASAAGGSGGGAISFSSAGSTGCSIDASTGVISIGNASGTCDISATKAGDSNYNATGDGPKSVTLNKASQAAFTLTVSSSITYGSTGTASAAGGSGGGAVSFSSTGSTGCSVDASTGVISVIDGSGTCAISAAKAGDSNYNGTGDGPKSVTLTKASQAAFILTVPSSITYASTGSASAAGGSGGGAVSFSSTGSTGCSVDASTGVISVIDASGTCAISAAKASDSNFNGTGDGPKSVALNKSTQAAFTLTVPSSITYGSTGTASAAGGSGGGAVTFSSTGSTGCSVNASTGVISVGNASGTCAISAAKAGDSNYNGTGDGPKSVALTKASQAAFTLTAPSSITYGSTGTASAAGGSGGGAVSFSSTGSTGCSVNASTGVISVGNASGTCDISAAKAGDSNYNATGDGPSSVTLNKASQAAFTLTVPSSITYGSTGTASAAGGSGGGAVTFSSTGSTGCSVNASTGVISVSDASGTCDISAAKASDSNYNGTGDGPKSVTLNKSSQAAFTLTVPSSITYGSTGTASAAGGSGGGAVTYSSGVSTGCSVNATSGVISVDDASGTCDISAAKAGDSNYNGTGNGPKSVTLNKASQAALTLTVPASITYGNTGTTSAAGGSGGGAVTFSSGASTGCSVDASTGIVSVSNASGTCAITATKASDNNYNAKSDGPKSITLNKANQDALTLTVPASIVYGNTGTASAAGGSGSGAVSFSNGSSTGCSVNATSGVISVSDATGTCAISANKAGDNNYNGPVSDGPSSVTLQKADQTIIFATLADKIYGNGDFNVSASAALAVSFGASGDCTVSGNSVHITGAGSCTITASQGGNNNYNAATSVPQSFSIAKANTSTAAANKTATFGDVALTLTSTISNTQTGAAVNGGTVVFSVINISTSAVLGTATSGVVTNGAAAAAFDPSGLPFGTYHIEAAYSGAANFNASCDCASGSLTVNKKPTTTAVSVTPSTVQFSDPVTLTAIINPANHAGSNVSGTVTFTISGTGGTQVVGPIPVVVSGSPAVATATTSAQILTVEASNATVTAVFTSTNNNFSGSAGGPASLIITPEDAVSQYVGDTYVQATSTGSASIALSAIINSVPDGFLGTVANARVTFVDRSGGNAPLGTCKDVKVNITDANKPSQGKATCIYTVSLAKSESSRSILVGTIVTYSHTDNARLEDAGVLITRNSSFALDGVGTLLSASPTSMYPGTVQPGATFNFSMTFTNKLTNPQGGGYIEFTVNNNGVNTTYLVKTTAVSNFTSAPGTTAVFTTKASIQDAVTGASVDGNAILQIEITDNGASGDLIAITVNGKTGGVVYSNNWNRTLGKTDKQGITSGNIVLSKQ